MHVQETRHVRRLVVRIEPGEDVVATLEKLVRSEVYRAGWIRGRGVLAWADVASWDDGQRAWRPARHLEGPLGVASLEGSITTRVGEPGVEIDVSLTREGGSTGGRLVSAAALSVELVVEVFEDIRLERQDDDALGMAVWRGDRTPGVVARTRTARIESVPPPARPSAPPAVEPAQPLVPAAASAVPASWAAVVDASAENERPVRGVVAAPSVRHAGQAPSFAKPVVAPASESPFPQRGDWVEHRQFGLCRVEGEDPDGGTRVRLPTGARKVLRLDVMEILPPRHEADRTVYPVRPRSR